jgi:hypothetical protein
MRVRDFTNIDWKNEPIERIIEFSQAEDKYPEGLHWETGIAPKEAKCLWDGLNWWKERNLEKKIRILELGSGFFTAGRIFAVWKIINGGEYFTCDTLRRAEVIETLDSIGLWQHINFIQGDSQKIFWNKEINFLFIDSEHSLVDALGEYLKYRLWLPVGSIIAFHDVALEPIKKTIEIAQSIDMLEPIFEHIGTGFGITVFHLKWRVELGKYQNNRA